MYGLGVDIDSLLQAFENAKSDFERRISALEARQNNYAAPLLNPDDRQKFIPAATEIIDGVTRLYTPILERKNNKLTVHIPDKLPAVYASSREISRKASTSA